ncbi:type II toxin-antitoxin system VapC family toxin [Nitratireductor aquibiodomus]|uniref:type II toxin-antitoxin system VapC family toxin n=1 Tax=Nitratireductor aquibiodomus TaxID=204799 RepID=UPI00046A6A9C|nr:type II toxin-antitoxin system VapC family toxin [Nitratireductor aquibiodomus]
MTRFVLDTSITAAWLLPDEDHDLALVVQESLLTSQAIVPPIWWFEICNLLVMCERRKRHTPAITQTILDALYDHPILVDDDIDPADMLRLSRAHGLTVYDASYLEIARRNAVPLATLDRRLAQAAIAETIPLFAS